MKLAALGVVTAGVGVALDVPGLIGIGALWMLVGLVTRPYARRMKDLRAATPKGTTPSVDARTFAVGTVLWLALGLPSLVVGLFEIGIDAAHEQWRWLPLLVGALALGIGVTGTILYLTGSAILAVSEAGPQPETPATLWVRAVRETGMLVNDRPRLELDLLVEPDATSGMASYEVTKKATVPFSAIGSLRPGDGFQALVAGPDHPASMDIHWDHPVRGGSSA